MKRKIYKLLSSAKQGLLALALTVFSFTAYSQATYTLNYTGNTQTLNLQAGTFNIKMWGGDGYTQTAGYNGKGGYSSGILTLTSAQTIYIYVGGVGSFPTSVAANVWTFNGGGIGYPANNNLYGNGGGATDIRTVGGSWDNATSLASRAIVAGGGSAGRNTSYIGANGGGLTGGTGTYFSPDQTGGPTGGSQTAGGSNTGYTSGLTLATLGKAMTWDGNTLTATFLAGGGGGYYGGASGRVAGGGGSSYIGGVTSGTTIMYGQTGFVTKPNSTGDGIVIIEELCNISLSSITSSGINAICNGNSATLTTNAVSNYSWSTGASTSSIVVSPTATTVYTLGATSPSNCTTSAAITITVNGSLPVLTVANTASSSGGICPTQTVMLTANGALAHNWSGGAIPVTNGVVFSPTSAVSYTVSGVNGCGTTTAVTSVSVHPFPTVNPSTSASTLCAGGGIILNVTGNATNYVWSGGVSPITSGVSFTPPVSATYTVVGTSALSCTAFATVPITVHPTPFNVPTANPALVCIGGSSTLSATGASNYTWTSGTQTVYTSDFVVTPVLGTTTYTITKANSTCFNTQVISVVTNSLPTIFAIVSPTVVCALSPATLAVGGAQTYTWTAPGPPSYTFTGPGPVVSPIVSSTYSVAASDGTCINVTTVYLAANPNPTITVSANTPSICEGGSVTLNATGGLTYNWLTSGGATLTGQTIAHSPTIATSYNVTGNNSFGCTSGASQVVLVHPKPTIVVNTNKIMVCDGGSAILTASGTANTYSWDANANSVLTHTALVNPTALVSSAITYTVEGTETTNGCKNTKTVSVNVFIPILTISGNTNTCAGGLINLSSTGGVLGSHSWNTGSGTPLTGVGISTPLNAAAVFTLTANSVTTQPIPLTCPATQTIALGIYFNPTITAVPSRTSICIKESVDISAAGGVSYNWSNNMTGSTITITPTGGTAINFTVTGTDANGCSSTGTVQVKISGCNSINELGNVTNGLSIYPNPNDGRFIIQSNSDIQLNLVNELGQLVRVIQLTATNNHEVNITDLAKGIYFVSGQKDNLQIYQKIVVAK